MSAWIVASWNGKNSTKPPEKCCNVVYFWGTKKAADRVAIEVHNEGHFDCTVVASVKNWFCSEGGYPRHMERWEKDDSAA